MQQLFQIATERGIVECATPQRGAVEFAVVAQECVAERFDDGAVAGFAASADGVRDVVGIQHAGAARGERGRHVGFAAADASGEADEIVIRNQGWDIVYQISGGE